MKYLTLLLISILPSSLLGNPHSGTLVKIKGQVQILTKPRVKSKNRKNEILFMKKYYILKKARIGAKVKRGEALQTGTNGQAKIVFPNGDSISIGPGSSYLLNSKNKSGKDKRVSLNLFYGKLRAIVSQKGPRNQLTVKTPSAVAGVRGTDLFVSYHAAKGSSVSVLRGQVEVSSAKSMNLRNKSTAMPTKISLLKAGQSAKVAHSDFNNSKELVSIIQTTKSTFIDIQRNSIINSPPPADLTETVQVEIAKLEKKSLNAIIEDIQKSSPLMAKKIRDEKIHDPKEINTLVIADLYKQAPREPSFIKPSTQDLQDIGEDVYNKYYDGSKKP